MRSSETGDRHTVFVERLLVSGCLLVASCSTAPGSSESAATATALECVVADAGVPAPNAETVTSLRRTVETGALYGVMARKAGLARCSIDSESGSVTLEYTFRDGGWLRVTRDPSIEYTNQEVRFASPPDEDPVAVLARTEQGAFGAKGCGIDWRQPDAQPAGDDPKATESIYRGDACNCQARVRNDAAGRVAGLVFRSAC